MNHLQMVEANKIVQVAKVSGLDMFFPTLD